MDNIKLINKIGLATLFVVLILLIFTQRNLIMRLMLNQPKNTNNPEEIFSGYSSYDCDITLDGVISGKAYIRNKQYRAKLSLNNLFEQNLLITGGNEYAWTVSNNTISELTKSKTAKNSDHFSILKNNKDLLNANSDTKYDCNYVSIPDSVFDIPVEKPVDQKIQLEIGSKYNALIGTILDSVWVLRKIENTKYTFMSPASSTVSVNNWPHMDHQRVSNIVYLDEKSEVHLNIEVISKSGLQVLNKEMYANGEPTNLQNEYDKIMNLYTGEPKITNEATNISPETDVDYKSLYKIVENKDTIVNNSIKAKYLHIYNLKRKIYEANYILEKDDFVFIINVISPMDTEKTKDLAEKFISSFNL